jgi:hypothetical protein
MFGVLRGLLMVLLVVVPVARVAKAGDLRGPNLLSGAMQAHVVRLVMSWMRVLARGGGFME